MPISICKSRTISLRLSEREFDSLKQRYAANGARSISEFIRSTMQPLIAETSREGRALELKVQEIEGKLSILNGEVGRLTHLVQVQ